MATYVLIHGAASTSWYWHLVVPELQRRGHEVVAVDLPCDDDSAGFPEYADEVVDSSATARASSWSRSRSPDSRHRWCVAALPWR